MERVDRSFIKKFLPMDLVNKVLFTLDVYIENSCTAVDNRFGQYNALCDEIWGKWLPDSKYISLIEPETFGCVEGYALLEIYARKSN